MNHCKDDADNNHCWERIGIDNKNKIVYHCTHCKEFAWEDIPDTFDWRATDRQCDKCKSQMLMILGGQHTGKYYCPKCKSSVMVLTYGGV